MAAAQIFALDANVFIEAARGYYAFDLAPSFWSALIERAAAGQLCSIDRVKGELLRGNDELAAWAKDSFHDGFASTESAEVVEVYRQVMIWAQQQAQYMDAAKAEFARSADGWLVAYAKARGCTVVTREQFRPDAKNRIFIPNVCRAFDVPWVDTFTMLRALAMKIG